MKQDDSTFQKLINSPAVKRRFEELLDQSAASFVSSVYAIYRSNSRLQECNYNSIMGAAGIAAALKLPINPSLGFAYIVPYKGVAQFQIGYKGLIQLAMRTNQYLTLNAGAVCEGQIKEIDFVTGEVIRGEKISDTIVGYIAYMELLNGFRKALYMTCEEIDEHAKKYSQSYAYDIKNGKKSSVWSLNFGAMAKKTVLKRLLNTYAVISIDQRDLTTAIQADQAVITEEGFRYVDNEPDGEEKTVPFDEEQASTFAEFNNLTPDDEPDKEEPNPNAE